MHARLLMLSLAAVLPMAVAGVPSGRAHPQQPDTGQETAGAPVVMQEGSEPGRRGQQGRGRRVFGKITAIQSDSLELAGQDGTKRSVKLTSKTEFRKERQAAKLSDFRVGDTVIVRIDSDSGKTSGATALMVAAAPQGFTGRGGGGGTQGGLAFMQGTLGKDYVVGEVKSVDPPKLTILRIDNVTQTMELNEETSLRSGRDSITMADIQVGDHVFARGAVVNDMFVPKNLNVIPPEMWKRMQEMRAENGPQGAVPPTTMPPPPQQKPPELPN
jgi:hypothetical protein